MKTDSPEEHWSAAYLSVMCKGESEVTTRFWDIQLLLSDGYTDIERKMVIVNSRIICNFVERKIYPLNHRCEFSRLVIECSKSGVKEEFLQSKDPRMATVRVQNDISGLDENNGEKLVAFDNLIRQGFQVASKYVALPKDEVFDALDEFKRMGYENKWIHAHKNWKSKLLGCSIECNHKIDVFELTQKIYKNGNLVLEAVVVRQMPRERLYHQYLGKLTLRGQNHLVFAKNNKVISTYNIDENTLEINEIS